MNLYEKYADFHKDIRRHVSRRGSLCDAATACAALDDLKLLEEKLVSMGLLREFVEDVATNWDCDDDQHKHGTRCRVCVAESIVRTLELEAKLRAAQQQMAQQHIIPSRIPLGEVKE